MLSPMDDAQLGNVLAALAMHVSEHINRRIEDVARHGAAAPSAIVVIWQHRGQTIDYLRKTLSLSHSGTVRLVERLVNDGLVVKGPASDARAVSLSCTAAGAKRARNILVARQAVIGPLIQSLASREKRQLENILRKIPWTGIKSKQEGVRTCRLCDLKACFIKRNCPVTIARLTVANRGTLAQRLRVQQTNYDPSNPDAVPSLNR